MKNYVIFFLTLTTLGTGYLAWSQHRELATLRAAPGNPERAAARRQAWNASPTAPAAADQPAEKPAAPPTPGAADVTRRGDRAFGQVMQVLENPDYQTLMNLTQKGMLDGRYAALFKQLKLTPQQLEQFKEYLVEKQTAVMDVLAAARAQGLDPRKDGEAIGTMMKATQAEIDANIRAALGDSTFETYQEYERTLPTRNVIGQLESRLSYSGTPLTQSQSQEMVRILAETGEGGRVPTIRTATPAVSIAGGPGANVQMGAAIAIASGGGVLITDATVARSQSVLSSDQVAALQEIQQEQQAAQQLGRSMRAEMGTRLTPPPGASAATPAVPAARP
ncbi:MAG: hypothetical protein KF897_09865 [Opitutaceae bacterium]|nr:hypothetical protein [Opitutaceae bacterium]